MTIKSSLPELRVFVALAESGHFTRAAERLGMSQSSLSAALGKLERLLGARLFDRHTRACSREVDKPGSATLLRAGLIGGFLRRVERFRPPPRDRVPGQQQHSRGREP